LKTYVYRNKSDGVKRELLCVLFKVKQNGICLKLEIGYGSTTDKICEQIMLNEQY